MKMTAVYYTEMISWICTVLVQWNNSVQVDMQLYLNTLSILSQLLSLFLYIYR